MEHQSFCIQLICFIGRCMSILVICNVNEALYVPNKQKSVYHHDMVDDLYEYHTGSMFFDLVRPIVDDDDAIELLVATESAKFPGIETMFYEARKLVRMFNTLSDSQSLLASTVLRYCCWQERFNDEIRYLLTRCRHWVSYHEQFEQSFVKMAENIGFRRQIVSLAISNENNRRATAYLPYTTERFFIGAS